MFAYACRAIHNPDVDPKSSIIEWIYRADPLLGSIIKELYLEYSRYADEAADVLWSAHYEYDEFKYDELYERFFVMRNDFIEYVKRIYRKIIGLGYRGQLIEYDDSDIEIAIDLTPHDLIALYFYAGGGTYQPDKDIPKLVIYILTFTAPTPFHHKIIIHRKHSHYGYPKSEATYP